MLEMCRHYYTDVSVDFLWHCFVDALCECVFCKLTYFAPAWNLGILQANCMRCFIHLTPCL